jgi:hypothetical protein
MFYSRPDLPQLGLDLAEVDGGLGRPSQYRGRTADGRPIFLTYDNGKLSIVTDDHDKRLGEELVSRQIGPSFNGDMLLEQICDLTGITLRGEKPVLSEETRRAAAEKSWVLDWSGKTTYWIADLQVTEEGGRRLIDELAAAFPDMRVLEVYWDYRGKEPRRRYIPRKRISQCHRSALIGFGVDEAKLAEMFQREHVKLADLDGVFAHYLDFQFDWNREGTPNAGERVSAKYRRPLATPDAPLTGCIETQFTTDDPQGKAYADLLVRTVHSCFSSWVEEIDLASGETIARPKSGNWYSSDLREWCAATSGRFITCGMDRAGRDIGVRACSAPV